MADPRKAVEKRLALQCYREVRVRREEKLEMYRRAQRRQKITEMIKVYIALQRMSRTAALKQLDEIESLPDRKISLKERRRILWDRNKYIRDLKINAFLASTQQFEHLDADDEWSSLDDAS